MVSDVGQFISNVWQFIRALYPYWLTAVTGSTLSVLVYLLFTLTPPSQTERRGVRETCVAYLAGLNKTQVFLTFVVTCIIVASYSAWIEKRNALANEHVTKEKAGAEYKKAEEEYKRTIADLQKQPPTASPSNTARLPTLKITRPETDDTVVERETAVSINANNVTPKLYLWLILRSPEGGDFPWIKCKAVNACGSQIPNPFPGGDWDGGEKIVIGAEGDVKRGNVQYTLRLVAVDKADNDRLAVIKPGEPATVTNPVAEFRRTVLRVK